MERVGVLDNQKMRKIKTSTLFSYPFWGTALGMLPVELTDSIPTAMTNGKRILVNPKFVEELTIPEFQGVLLHELLHVIFRHCDKNRVNDRNRTLWNIAGDYIINRVLHDSGISLPKGALLSDKYNGTMTTEYVYNDLLENSEDMQEVISAFNSSGMPDIDPTDLSPEDVNKIKQILGAAAQVGKAAGNMPAGLEELIEGMLNPKVPWYVLMRRYVQEIIGLRDDYTYVRPNKRYEDLIIPSAYTGEMVTCIVVAIDSSASVSSDDLKQFASEVGALSSAVADLIVLSCDTEVHEIARKDSCEDKIASLKVVGRGGTYFEPVFQWVRESGVIPDVLVYMTDGYAEFPEKAPGYPVVWLINNNQVDPPWGNTIRI